MHRFVTDRRPSSALPQGLRIEFYREELIKHQRCLQRQREYYSERAIARPSRRWPGCSPSWISCAGRRTRTR